MTAAKQTMAIMKQVVKEDIDQGLPESQEHYFCTLTGEYCSRLGEIRNTTRESDGIFCDHFSNLNNLPGEPLVYHRLVQTFSQKRSRVSS